ncbi:MAG: DUF3464 family protein [Oscillatoria sp. SIO1A7]|nr:DUF3464 family protein [Oscillatoria sp. SIO1A7]
MSEESESKRSLPFEPGKRKKTSKRPPAKQPKPEVAEGANSAPASLKETAIPEAVSRRMIRRMAIFCGLPTALGISTFFVSYAIVSNGWLELPNTLTLLTSIGFFGLGVLGLSYGVLSASWDETTPGSMVGLSEFSTNLGRMMAARRSAKEKRQ